MYGLHWLIHVKFTTSAGIALGYVIEHIPHSVGTSPWLISFCAQKIIITDCSKLRCKRQNGNHGSHNKIPASL